jgi:hypothetical protein
MLLKGVLKVSRAVNVWAPPSRMSAAGGDEGKATTDQDSACT